MKAGLKLMTSVLFCFVFGTVFAEGLGTDPMTTVGVCVGISTGLSFAPMSVGAYEVVLQSLIETELIREIRFEHMWLETVESKDEYVGNNVINLTEIGVDPEVLTDNVSYPIATVAGTDIGHVISLKKHDTKNTKISRDELYSLTYDKESIYRDKHRKALEERTARLGLHTIAPTADSVGTPILSTTGPVREGRHTLTYSDIVRAKEKLTLAGYDLSGRVLVLCNEHISDLLINDGSFADRYNNHKEGTIVEKYAGFKIYEDIYNPVFDTSNEKKAFAAAAAGTDRNGSIFFYAPRVVKARGEIEAFLSEAKNDPEYRQSKFGARLWSIVVPMKLHGIGAIVSVPWVDPEA